MATKTVLICDDDDHYREALEMSLESFGLDVIAVGNANSGFSMARSNKIELAIIDVFMPDQDGIELAQRLNNFHPALPILVCSGKAEVFQSTMVPLGLGFVSGLFPKTIELDSLKRLVFDVLEEGN